MLICASQETFWILWWGGEIHIGIGTEYNNTDTDYIMGGVKTESFIPVALALEVTDVGVTVDFDVIESEYCLSANLVYYRSNLPVCPSTK